MSVDLKANAPETKPKRRWLRFSLRTLLLATAVFGCWLAYEANWIRHRHQLLAARIDTLNRVRELAGLSPFVGHPVDRKEIPTKGYLHTVSFGAHNNSGVSPSARQKRESLVLRLFGEESQKQITLLFEVKPKPFDPHGERDNKIENRMYHAWYDMATKDAAIKSAEELFPEADVIIVLLYVEPFAPVQQ